MSFRAHIGLGSNLGDRKATLDAAVALLRETSGITVRALSSFHETTPAGGPAGQGAFLNAAAALDTMLEPEALLRRLREIEERLGRVRTIRWDERTLDLDFLLFGESIIDTPRLTVPHPRMAVRRFVLAPLAEIAPDAVDPLTRRTVADLLDNLDRRPSVLGMARSAEDRLPVERLVQELDAETMSWNQLTILHDSGRSGPARRFDRILDHATRDDRWVVADFWSDERLSDLRAEMGQLRAELRPTFVVVAGSEADESLSDWAQRSHPFYPLGCDVPILRLRTDNSSTDDEPALRERRLAEVLAACASTRG